MTLLAFSYNVLVGVEAIRGAELPSGEQEAFLHLWRYMGHLMGVAEEHNPCAGATPSRSKGPPLQPVFCTRRVVSLTTSQRPPRRLASLLAPWQAGWLTPRPLSRASSCTSCTPTPPPSRYARPPPGGPQPPSPASPRFDRAGLSQTPPLSLPCEAPHASFLILVVQVSHHLLRAPYSGLGKQKEEKGFVYSAQMTRLLVRATHRTPHPQRLPIVPSHLLRPDTSPHRWATSWATRCSSPSSSPRAPKRGAR